MIPVIRRTETEIVGRNSMGETIRVVAEGGQYPIYHSDIGQEPCSLIGAAGLFLVLDPLGRPQVIGQDEMLFILWAIEQLGGGPVQLGHRK